MYTIVIDESGDVGLKNLQADPSSGPTQYFCMCAAIFNEENRDQITDRLSDFRDRKGRIHATNLGHFERVNLCRTIATLPIGMLGVISNKLTLLDYLKEAQKTPTHYYNKVSQYLFERIGQALGEFNISKDKVRICIEAREQQYSSLLSLLHSIQSTPLDERALPIRNIDRFSISAVKKKDDLLMSLADIGANAMFLSVRKDERTYSLTETRYLKELSPVFLSARDGKIVPKGLKPIHSLADLGLDDETRIQISRLKNDRKDYQRIT
ncbi:DUF3800 domain-containing protein [Ruegeria arenilitoris]|uniref:DUF3800 domain-containing protein n=1 Tax=Ruegeria arenilitoris TaxID=1173585 RepID=UPI00147BEBAF|nr:DUF3800 domain-containing protein [Ruegeria arenilitoris]